MIHINSIETVNFYGDNIEIAVSDNGSAYVSVGQITGYLGINSDRIIDMFAKDPRVQMSFIEDAAVVPLDKLNGFLMLLPVDMVQEEMKEDLMRYQVECFEVLQDYWLQGVALNRREVPYNINSKFKDERAISRAALTKACAKYCKKNAELDPHDIFDKVLAASYNTIGLTPLHEYEKLTGVEARYLSWVESVFAKTIDKFATFEEVHQDVVNEAWSHVKQHLADTGNAWLTMADNIPSTVYHN